MKLLAGFLIGSLLLAQQVKPGGGSPASPPINTTADRYAYADTATSLDGSDILSRDGTNRRNVMDRAGIQFDGVAAPSAPTAALITAAGNIEAGEHQYCFSYVTAQGETECSAFSNSVTNDGSNQQNSVTGLGSSCPTGATSKSLYRNYADGGFDSYFLASIACGTASYTDNISDATLDYDQAASSTNDTAGKVYWRSDRYYLVSNVLRFGNTASDFDTSFTFPFYGSFYDTAFYTTAPNSIASSLFQDTSSVYIKVIAPTNANTTTHNLSGLVVTSNITGTNNYSTARGIYIDAVGNSSGTTFANGFQVNALAAAALVKAGEASLVVGNSSSATVDSGADATEVFALQGNVSAAGAGSTIVTGAGLYIHPAATSGGATITTNIGIDVGNQTAGSTNYAIRSGLGKVDFGDIVAPKRQAGDPVACASGYYGYTYFNTTDKRLCVCIADGTDDAWVKSSDYTHATGHCTP